METATNNAARFEPARGNCYQAAHSLMMIIGNRNNVQLCHGIATQTRPPYHKMGHAWVEVTEPGGVGCIDGLFPMNVVDQSVYYEIGKINPADVVRYDFFEAKTAAKRRGHYGPWHERIVAAAHRDPETGGVVNPQPQPVRYFGADDDGHFNRAGHAEEMCGVFCCHCHKPAASICRECGIVFCGESGCDECAAHRHALQPIGTN